VRVHWKRTGVVPQTAENRPQGERADWGGMKKEGKQNEGGGRGSGHRKQLLAAVQRGGSRKQDPTEGTDQEKRYIKRNGGRRFKGYSIFVKNKPKEMNKISGRLWIEKGSEKKRDVTVLREISTLPSAVTKPERVNCGTAGSIKLVEEQCG